MGRMATVMDDHTRATLSQRAALFFKLYFFAFWTNRSIMRLRRQVNLFAFLLVPASSLLLIVIPNSRNEEHLKSI